MEEAFEKWWKDAGFLTGYELAKAAWVNAWIQAYAEGQSKERDFQRYMSEKRPEDWPGGGSFNFGGAR